VQDKVIQKLDQLGININLRDVKIFYNGMQKIAGKPYAYVWTFHCIGLPPTSFWVRY